MQSDIDLARRWRQALVTPIIIVAGTLTRAATGVRS